MSATSATKVRKAWPRQPFVGFAGAALLGILAAEWLARDAPVLWLAALFAGWAWRRRASWPVYFCAALVFYHLHYLRLTTGPGRELARSTGEERIAFAVRGTVASEPTVSPRGMASFRFRLWEYERDGKWHASRATILARWPGEPRYGDALQLFGVLQPVDGPRNPGEFDMRCYLQRRDVYQQLIVRYRENGRLLGRERGNAVLRLAHSSRDWMQAMLARGIEDAPEVHGLISAMVLGVRDDTADEVEEQFQQTGTIHLFSVSGLHVGIVAYLLWTLARLIRLPRRTTIALIIPALFFYAAVTGFNTATVRAALMATFLLGGQLFDRPVRPGNSVAAAGVVILAFDTNQLFATGFQLSFAVVIAIILLAERFFEMFARWGAPDEFLPRSLLPPLQRAWLRGWRATAGAASVSVAAWIGSLPLIVPYFYLVTPISLFANLAIVPIAFLVLAVGLMSLLAGLLAPILVIVFNNANWFLGTAILALAEMFAAAPAGHFYTELPHRRNDAQVELMVLDVGAGAAIHLRAEGADWLIDCGRERDFRRLVRSYLRSRGVNRLDGIILTHGDSGHLGAGLSVMRAFRPREVIMPGAPSRSAAHRALETHLAQHSVMRREWAAPQHVEIAPRVRARILHPPAGYDRAAADDEALVVQLVIADRWRVLLVSDSGLPTEKLLLKQNAELASDILIKGQHTSGVSGSPEFLARVRPRAIVATSPGFPENEQLKEEWALEVAQRGIRLWRQDRTGAVQLRFYPDRWEATPFLSAPRRAGRQQVSSDARPSHSR